jgi:hypothetical protein
MTSIVQRVYVDQQRIDVPAANPAVSVSPRLIATGDAPALTTADGTNATPSVTETYLAELYVPVGVTTTGVALFNGSAVAGNVTVGLYNALGNLVGKSASTGQASTDAYQLVPLALTLTPGTYFVAAQFNNTSARFNTHVFGTFGAGKLTSQTYGTMPSGITLPTTFTTGLGPIASLY